MNILDIDKVDIRLIKAEGDKLLLQSQQQLESIIQAIGECEDGLADSIIAFENGKSEGYKKIREEHPNMKIMTAKAMAREQCNTSYREMIGLEHTKNKLLAYKEGVLERMKTFKIILKVNLSDM
jgi:hypothetical protein